MKFFIHLFIIALVLPVLSQAQTPVDADPGGVLRKPIPDKLVVLTFDDAPASHATIVAPILKPLGFGGSFYVCDFDSFKTRKDWYMTFRQMNELDRKGFEIGNHTVGHGGGLDNYLAMEDELIANNGPKMITICWPLYGVVWNICPDLAKLVGGIHPTPIPAASCVVWHLLHSEKYHQIIRNLQVFKRPDSFSSCNTSVSSGS